MLKFVAKKGGRALLARRFLSQTSVESDMIVGAIAEKIRSGEEKPLYGPGSEEAASSKAHIDARARYATVRGRQRARAAVAAHAARITAIDEDIARADAMGRLLRLSQDDNDGGGAARPGAPGGSGESSADTGSADSLSGSDAQMTSRALLRRENRGRLARRGLDGYLMDLPLDDASVRSGDVFTEGGPYAENEAAREHARIVKEIVPGGSLCPRGSGAAMGRVLAAAREAGGGDAAGKLPFVAREGRDGPMSRGEFDAMCAAIATGDIEWMSRASSRAVPPTRFSAEGAVEVTFPHELKVVGLDPDYENEAELPVAQAARAVLSFPVSGLGLTAAARERFVELVGPRYNSSTGWCRFSVLRSRDRPENVTHAYWQVRECVLEAHKADASEAGAEVSAPVEALFPEGIPAVETEDVVAERAEDAIRAFIGEDKYVAPAGDVAGLPAVEPWDAPELLDSLSSIIEERKARLNIVEVVDNDEPTTQGFDENASDTEEDERF